MKRKLNVGIALLLLAGIYSCTPDPVFPEQPVLKFKEFIYNGSDTLKAVFSFTDGDGDIGVSPVGTDSNMVLTLYYKAPDGNFYVVDNPNTSAADSIYYPYRIPELPEGQSGLEGDIYLVVNPSFIIYDTIQFNAFLLDQSRNKSEVVRTPEFVINP